MVRTELLLQVRALSRPLSPAPTRLTIALALLCCRCGNVASILELDENLNQKYITFDAATQENRGLPAKSPALEHYFL